MFSLKQLIGYYGHSEYIWVDALLITETEKAILVMFDGRKHWLPKAWIAKIKRRNNAALF